MAQGLSSPDNDNAVPGERDAQSVSPEPVVWLVRNKIDLLDQAVERNEFYERRIESDEPGPTPNKPLKNIVKNELTGKNESGKYNSEYRFNISAVSGDGFEPLLSDLNHFAESYMAGAESALVTRQRHRHTLEDCLAALRRALTEPAASREDLLAEELRVAAQALGRLTGRVDVEDILDVIFRDFCIGK